MAYSANQFSFGQSISVTSAGVGFLGNVSRMGAKRTIRSRPVLTSTATNLPFGAGAVELSSTTGGSYQSLADFLATATNAQYLQGYFAGIAVRNVKTNLTYTTLSQPAITTVSTTMTQATPGSTTVVVASATNIQAGQLMEGYGLQAGTTVVSISSTTVTISLATLYAIAGGTAVSFTNQITSFGTGYYAAGQEADVLLEGSTTVLITNGTPQNNYPVYIRTVANSSIAGTSVGDFEAASDLATSAITIGTTIGSPNVTTSAATGLAPGQYVTSPYFPSNTYIVSGATTSWVFSQNALATVGSGAAMSAYNTALIGAGTGNPYGWMRFSTGQQDNNGVCEVTILNRVAA